MKNIIWRRILTILETVCAVISLFLFALEKITGKDNGPIILLILLIATITYLAIAEGRNFKEKVDFKSNRNVEVTLYKSDYIETLKKLSDSKSLLCVVGINNCLDMYNIGPTGVHNAIKEKLFNDIGYRNLSDSVKREIGSEYGREMEPGTCVLVPFESSEYKMENAKILFAVNSKRYEQGKRISGFDYIKVIDNIFEYLEERGVEWETLLFPVISGRNVYPRNKAQYVLTVEYIVSKFLEINEEKRVGKHLVIALNPSSIKDNGYKFSEICDVVEMIGHYDN